MNKLIKIEKATCEGEFIGYRIKFPMTGNNGLMYSCLIFNDQDSFPGIRHGQEFIPTIGKEILYEEQKIVDADVHCS